MKWKVRAHRLIGTDFPVGTMYELQNAIIYSALKGNHFILTWAAQELEISIRTLRSWVSENRDLVKDHQIDLRKHRSEQIKVQIERLKPQIEKMVKEGKTINEICRLLWRETLSPETLRRHLRKSDPLLYAVMKDNGMREKGGYRRREESMVP